LFAAADWIAVWYQKTRTSYFTKPAAIAALMIWFVITGHLQSNQVFFGIGLLLSLVGDVFLLLTRRWFRAGLLAFLCAHLAYIYAFNQTLPEMSLTFYILALTIFSLWLMIFAYLRAAMRQSSRHARMLPSVSVYSAVIALMLFSALMTLFRPDWSQCAGILSASGGMLFFISDTMLALDRFVRPFKRARFWVRTSYHLGQFLLAAGALYQVLG
jgi:uncharacterized membrane protein YhhN